MYILCYAIEEIMKILYQIETNKNPYLHFSPTHRQRAKKR